LASGVDVVNGERVKEAILAKSEEKKFALRYWSYQEHQYGVCYGRECKAAPFWRLKELFR
jgi:phosphopantetheinyl transferase (holo-ACP synthase)